MKLFDLHVCGFKIILSEVLKFDESEVRPYWTCPQNQLKIKG